MPLGAGTFFLTLKITYCTWDEEAQVLPGRPQSQPWLVVRMWLMECVKHNSWKRRLRPILRREGLGKPPLFQPRKRLEAGSEHPF